jgi:hypothetical protein
MQTIERQIELEHIDPALAEHTEERALLMRGDEGLDLPEG